ncbi:hypothetical protein [Dactylosporangium sp. CA-233914]|uniref:hypothetical protein n=1 Tax=Dactylosporangium sp. CA-233914 TaxID=3239934 RepID=UPI003D926C65
MTTLQAHPPVPTGNAEAAVGRIAAAALDEIPDGATIAVDAGAITVRMVEMLPRDRALTVVVNSPTLVARLPARRTITAFLVGGRLRGDTLTATDAWALRTWASLCVDVAFVCPSGCSVRGLSAADPALATAGRAVIAAASRTVVLAEGTRIGRDDVARFAALSDVDLIVTDHRDGDAHVAAMEALGVRFRRV